MKDKRAPFPINTLKNNSRIFWLKFLRESKGIVMILVFGLFFVYLGFVQIIDAYYCLPSSKNDLELINGELIGIDKSKRFGDTILLDTGGDIRHIRGVIAKNEEFSLQVGKPVTIGVVSGLVCTPLPEYIEVEQMVIREFSTSGRLKGRWLTNLLAFVCFVMAALIIPKASSRLVCIFKKIKTGD